MLRIVSIVLTLLSGIMAISTYGGDCRGIMGPSGTFRCVDDCPIVAFCSEVDLGGGNSACGCDGNVSICCHMVYNSSTGLPSPVGICGLGCPAGANCFIAVLPGWKEALCGTPPY